MYRISGGKIPPGTKTINEINVWGDKNNQLETIRKFPPTIRSGNEDVSTEYFYPPTKNYFIKC